MSMSPSTTIHNGEFQHRPIYLFIIHRNSNVCHICHGYRYVPSRNVHDLDLLNGLRSNSKYANRKLSCELILMAIVMFTLSVTVSEIFTVKSYMISTFGMDQGQIQIWQLKRHATLYLKAIAMLTVSATICEIITCELQNVLDSN